MSDLRRFRAAAHPHRLLSALAAAGVLLAAVPSGAQSTLPATPATSVATPFAATAAPGTTDSRPHRARVSYTGGLLDVHADNSSLNGILYEITRATGMRITGGVRDQRVFGNYGPASPQDVLATLLDGTGTNMLLKEGPDGESPLELVLTARTGEASPPSPAATTYAADPADDDGDAQPAPASSAPARPAAQIPSRNGAAGASAQTDPASGLPIVAQPLNNPLGSPGNTTPTASQLPTAQSQPIDSVPEPSTATQPQQGIVDSANPPPAGTTTSTSPNAVATPEQIYQQLLKLQQQSGAAPAGTTPTPPQPPQ